MCSSEWDQKFGMWIPGSMLKTATESFFLFLFFFQIHASNMKKRWCHTRKMNLPVQHWQKVCVNVLYMHANPASESKPKVSLMPWRLYLAASVMLLGFFFKCLGLVYRLSSQSPSCGRSFHWNSYCSFWDIVPSNHSKNVWAVVKHP